MAIKRINNTQARLTIRRACEGDVDSIVSLHISAIKFMRSLCPPGFGKAIQAPLKRKEIDSWVSETLADKRSIFLVCETGGEFAGFALGSVETFKDDLIDAPFLTVEFVETEPRFRRLGVACSLLQRMERIAKRRGLKAIELTAWANNDSAIRLYEKLGYCTLEMRLAKPLSSIE